MTPEERSLIEGLFQRLNDAAKTLPPAQVDPEADRLIRNAVSAQPMAPYLLTQNALVMENAMQAAQARIAELEAEVKAKAEPAPAQPRSFLSGASPWTRGGASAAPPAAAPAPGFPQQGYGQPGPAQPGYGQPAPAYAQPANGQPAGQPSFMRSALTTAAGIAGGALLFQGISSLMSSHGGGALSGMAQQASQAVPNVVNETVNNYYGEAAPSSGAAYQDASYSPPADNGGYTPASYDAPEPDYDPGYGDEEV
jgi:hypothetical protein